MKIQHAKRVSIDILVWDRWSWPEFQRAAKSIEKQTRRIFFRFIFGYWEIAITYDKGF